MKNEMSAPIADLRGFRVECTGEGEAVGILDAGPQHANPMGTLHGGVLCVANAASTCTVVRRDDAKAR